MEQKQTPDFNLYDVKGEKIYEDPTETKDTSNTDSTRNKPNKLATMIESAHKRGRWAMSDCYHQAANRLYLMKVAGKEITTQDFKAEMVSPAQAFGNYLAGFLGLVEKPRQVCFGTNENYTQNIERRFN